MRAIVVLLTMTVVSQSVGKRSDLDGVWILLRSQTGKFQLTPEGEKKRAAYDFQKDDPDFQCRPASITRVMHTPSPPIEVRQQVDHVEINYEFMDVKRRVQLKLKSGAPVPYAVTEHPHLGRSIGVYDGETLVIETDNVEAGILDTLSAPGLYQSEQMRTTERWIPKGNNMEVVITHYDPVHFVQPWTATYSYLRLPGGKIERWDCKPEEATFERFVPEKK